VIQTALGRKGLTDKDIAALGITNQRETTVVWDRHTGRPVHNAIVWQDTRSSAVLPAVAADMPEAEIQARSGLPLVTYFSGPKVRWLLDSSPALRERAERGDLLFGTMDSWLVWNLTGGPANGTVGGAHVTDVTNASRTMLMNLSTLDWDPELLAAMRVPRAMLPEIRPTVSSFGTTVAPIEGIPLTAVIGDQQASLFGQAGFDRGDAKCTFGTGGFLLLNTGTSPVRSQHGLITTVAHAMEGEPAAYALEGSIAVAGSLVQWFRDSLGLIRSAAEIETQALTVPDNGGCYVVPAFTGLYAPHWEPDARGVIVGLTSYVTKAHLCRAVLEATAWQTREVIDAMNADAAAPLTRLAVDGGMTADNLLMQTIADFLDIPVVRPMVAETVSRGAAYAAGLGAGYWPDRQVLRRHWRRAAEWLPAMSAADRDAEFARWRRAVELAIGWGARDLSCVSRPRTRPGT
ncbi:FGGY family carbohydrate kinase, partial [Nocardioides sp. NPDC057772]|uniref:FGGY family carbohydrate kinase n=1 Tax=Nocardioides sp. NPDC057772 TaxID=3346245 RepID=UPI00367314CA